MLNLHQSWDLNFVHSAEDDPMHTTDQSPAKLENPEKPKIPEDTQWIPIRFYLVLRIKIYSTLVLSWHIVLI